MTFQEAQNFHMLFGKYKGQTIEEVAKTDEGLKYLDWLFGQEIRDPRFRQALETYLSDENIQRELEEILE